MKDFTTTNSNSLFIRAAEVCEILDVSAPTAYRVMQQLNDELAAMGYITLAGRTNRAYFMQKVCGCPVIAEVGA